MEPIKSNFTITDENVIKSCSNSKPLLHYTRKRHRKPTDIINKCCSGAKSLLDYTRQGEKKDQNFPKGGSGDSRKLSTDDIVEVFFEGVWRKGKILEVLIEGLTYIVLVDAKVLVEVCGPYLRVLQNSEDGSLINSPLDHLQIECCRTENNGDEVHTTQGISVDASSELGRMAEVKPADKRKKRNVKIKYARETVNAKFSPGTTVEVRSDEDGYEGSWYAADIVSSAGVDKFLVEYKTLKTNDGIEYLKATADEKDIRPYPPHISQRCRYKVFEEVDVWYHDGWWEGVISKVLDDWKYSVYFASSNKQLICQHLDLRNHQNWVDGKWVLASQASKIIPSAEETPEEDFTQGMLVEIRTYEEDYRGSWYAATIIGFPAKGKLLVEYDSLKTNDNKQLLIEEVSVNDARPSPPVLHAGRYKCSQEVDAFRNGGWWVGVISEVLVRKKCLVFFASTGMTEEFDQVCLRPHQDWINGKWIVCKKRPSNLKLSTSSSEIEQDQSNYAETFGKGTRVEVTSNEPGFEGSWYSAVIVQPKAKNKFLIEYKTLKTENQRKYLRELTDACNLRPFPPARDVHGPYRLLETVDAWYNDGWWEGVISKVLDSENYMVYFKTSRDELEFDHGNLRTHQEWIQGKWISAYKD